MIIFPAMDLKNGKCVRLQKGDFAKETIYRENPLEVAIEFESSGATWIHIIDLDGAFDGTNKNIEVIKSILKNTNLKVQFGGGIRDSKKIKMLLDLGITRVILGTFAITNFQEIKELIQVYPDRIIVSVDCYQGLVTYNGWQNKTKLQTLDFCKQLESIGINTIVYTDIEKDGMMQGPNFEDYKILSSQTTLNLIASGGIRDCNDIEKLQETNLYGAIIGKSLYIKNVTLKEVFQCLQEE